MARRRNAKLVGKARQSARIKDAPARQERQAAAARALYRQDDLPITRKIDDWDKMDELMVESD